VIVPVNGGLLKCQRNEIIDATKGQIAALSAEFSDEEATIGRIFSQDKQRAGTPSQGDRSSWRKSKG